jgi:hypothetical protein
MFVKHQDIYRLVCQLVGYLEPGETAANDDYFREF